MNLRKLLDAKWPDWYAFRDGGNRAEIRIDGVIGGDWFGDGVTADAFIREFNALRADEIDLHVNSPGGDVWDGFAIYNILAASGKTVHGFVDGLAASIASVLLMACDTIEMPENAYLMIHDPWTLAIGNARELRPEADRLDTSARRSRKSTPTAPGGISRSSGS